MTVRRLALLASWLALAVPAPLAAQDPASLAPGLYKVEIDNSWVRVLRLRLSPGDRTPRYSHPPEVVVWVSPEPGRVVFRPAATEPEGRTATEPQEEVVIHLKQRPPTSTPIALDPIAVDPKYHKTLLDNEYVRAIRTILEPGLKSPLHEHPHYVVVYITELHTTMTLGDGREVDNPRHKGDIGWRDYMRHETLNIGKETAEEIQVELK